jgi:hypothetical protein
VVIAALLVLNRPTFTPTVTGAPSLQLSQTSFDYGDVPMGQYVETVFTVRNMGDKTLVMRGEPIVKVVEGCCPPRAVMSRTILQPGEEATVRLRFTMTPGMGGPHEFQVLLSSNDPALPETYVTILSNWI